MSREPGRAERPPNAEDKRHLIPIIQKWAQYAGKERVIDAWFEPDTQTLKTVTIPFEIKD